MLEYSIEFQTLAAESDWNASSLTDALYKGLSDDIKDELAARDAPTDLDALVAMAIEKVSETLISVRRIRVNMSFVCPLGRVCSLGSLVGARGSKGGTDCVTIAI